MPDKFWEKSFENYIISEDGQQNASDMCYEFAKHPAIYTGLILYGKSQTGKDHLTSAIGKVLIGDGKTFYMITAKKMYRKLKDARTQRLTEESIIEFFIEPDVLAITEIGLQGSSDDEFQFINEIITDRDDRKKKTILNTNLKPDELIAVVGDRAINRILANGIKIPFTWDPFIQAKNQP